MEVLFWVSYLLLWGLALLLTFGLFVVYRHLGQQLLITREARQNQGPELGTRLPPARLRTLDGQIVELNGARERPLLVFFATAVCKPCKSARKSLARFAERGVNSVETVLVCRGSDEAVAQFARGLPALIRVVADRSWEFGGRLRIATAPFALIADRGLIVRGKGAPQDVDEFQWLLNQLSEEAVSPVALLDRPLSSDRTV